MTRAGLLHDLWPANASAGGQAIPGVGWLTHFEARRQQQVRAMPFRHPTMVLVRAGCKQVNRAGELQQIGPGQLLAVPAGLTLDLGNVPGPTGVYRALVLSFAPELIQRLALAYPELVRDLLQQPARLQLKGEAAPALEAAVQRLQAAPTSHLAVHEGLAILLLLAQAGFAQLLLGRERSITDRVQDLVELQPDFPWTAGVVAERLSVSVATLHRQLRHEERRFTELLQEVRLGHALQQLLNSRRPVGEIAAACGYASASRFAVRFRQRFGCAPSELR